MSASSDLGKVKAASARPLIPTSVPELEAIDISALDDSQHDTTVDLRSNVRLLQHYHGKKKRTTAKDDPLPASATNTQSALSARQRTIEQLKAKLPPQVVQMQSLSSPLQAAPLDSTKERQKQRKKEQADKLDQWFGLPKQELTPEVKNELLALRLRGVADPKRFYKGQDSKKLPTHFHIAKVVEGGMPGVGGGRESIARGALSRRRNRRGGESLLSDLLKSAEVDKWSKRKYGELQQRAQEGSKSDFKERKKRRKRQ
ncbi:unnamed protein product [Vitrella brassicaformis CCMP3155]|uniref:Fcf2 pre-rRNA processing C-terminal domain-containing protein n=1 Tax=Vitrella brassicaformis (strain CCMP3155) TaxID=1169540 RepID=A0A0G4F3D3_VITBC|nr:unnamed protein product [Vitrella brassicaformis CCMP3155]|eukprot:CEM06432.1 unnamed protein product [Vitrella brassicaformis CCMP3155]